MLQTPTSHRYLAFPREAPRVLSYANLFRFGESNVPAPLVTYVGGATGRQTYLERSNPAPNHLVMMEAGKALPGGDPNLHALDLLVCPCPLESGGKGTEWFVEHFDDELLPALDQRPTACGFVGYSAGAEYATYLAIVNEAHALAVFGGTGVTQTARELRNVLENSVADGHRLRVALFRNSGDGTAETASMAQLLTMCDVTAYPVQAGEHAFRFYSANGTVAAAFRFVIEHLGRKRT